MAKRRTKRHQKRQKRRAERESGQRRPGGKSAYAKKSAWCHAHGVWGFDVPSPKPWKSL